MCELNFELLLVPETYLYNQEEIIYRIYFNDQLIIERSLPILNFNEAVKEIFSIKLINVEQKNNLVLLNCRDKKVKLTKMKLNDFYFNESSCFQIEFEDIVITIKP